MAIRIPEYQEQQSPSAAVPEATASAEAFGGGIGAAIGKLGVSLSDVAERRQKVVEQQEYFDTLVKEDQLIQRIGEREMEAQQNAPPNATGYSQGFMKEVAKERDTFLSSVSPRLRGMFEARLAGRTTQYALRSGKFEQGQRQNYEAAALTTLVNGAIPSIEANPDAYDAHQAEILERVEASTLSVSAKHAARQAIEENLAKARINGLRRLGRGREADDFEIQLDERERQRQQSAPALGPAPAGAAPGYVAPRADVESHIVQSARARGIDPNIALRVYRSEGSSQWQSTVVKNGHRERSYGPFQLYIDGGLGNKFQRETGLDPRDPNTWRENIDFALDEAKKGGWGPWYGAKAVGVTGRMGLDGQPIRTAQAGTGTATDASSSSARGGPQGDINDLNTDLPVGRWQAYGQKVQADVDKKNAALAREASREIGDYSAFVRSGSERDPAKEAEIQGRYGGVVGQAVKDRFDQDAAFGAKVRSIETATPEELNKIIGDYQTRLKSSENFAENSKEFADILKVVQGRNKALGDDPATYVLRSDDVKQAHTAFETAQQSAPEAAPGLARDYADATLAEQRRLGVPPEMQRVLTPQMADRISKQFLATDGQNAAAVMRSLEAQWGNRWPQVFGELAGAKALPGAALVVGAMNRPDQARAAEQLAEAVKVGKAALEKMHADESKKDLHKGVLDRMKDFRSTLVNSPGAETAFNTFNDATYLLALSYLGQGDSVDTAAKRAFNDVLGKKYEFAGTYRVPREHDASAVRNGANEALFDILPKADIDLPRSLGGMKSPEVKSNYVRALQANGFWVTAPDESGLVLYEGTQRRAVTVGGKPFTVPWSRLTGYGPEFAPDDPAQYGPVINDPPDLRGPPAPKAKPAAPKPKPEPVDDFGGTGLTLPGGAP